MFIRWVRITALAAALAGPLAGLAAAQAVSDAPAGTYKLDLGHGRLLFRVSHLAFSRYTALFTRFDAKLAFDPEKPEAMQVTATVDATSLETHYPDPAVDFNAIITGPQFLDAAQFPSIGFISTGVAVTGPQTADVTGDLTLHGVTRPLTLKVTFNGGYAGHPLDAGARIGFSAEGVLNRSDFGIVAGIPASGTTMGVGDAVEVLIEAEFLNPDAPKP